MFRSRSDLGILGVDDILLWCIHSRGYLGWYPSKKTIKPRSQWTHRVFFYDLPRCSENAFLWNPSCENSSWTVNRSQCFYRWVDKCDVWQRWENQSESGNHGFITTDFRFTVNTGYNESGYNEFVYDSLVNRLPPLFVWEITKFFALRIR